MFLYFSHLSVELLYKLFVVEFKMYETETGQIIELFDEKQ